MLKLGHYKIGRLAGINIYFHFTFMFLLGILLFASLFSGNIFQYLILLSSVFFFVVLHELGHALMARKFGIPTESITLYPIGGVAKISGRPKNSNQEILISLAGPAVNVGLVFLLFPFSMFFTSIGSYWLAVFFQQLAYINIALAIFNLLPAFPMDGGRVLRAVLSKYMDNLRATEISATVGKVFAVGFVLLAFHPSFSFILLIIGFFIWQAGNNEVRAHKIQASQGGQGQSFYRPVMDENRVFTFRFRQWH